MVRFLAVVMGGLPALAPAPPALVMNPLMANVLGGLSADDVPFQEGWLKLRGIPFSVTKTDIIQFFTARRFHPRTACLLPRCRDASSSVTCTSSACGMAAAHAWTRCLLCPLAKEYLAALLLHHLDCFSPYALLHKCRSACPDVVARLSRAAGTEVEGKLVLGIDRRSMCDANLNMAGPGAKLRLSMCI